MMALVGCSESTTEPTTGPFPDKPSFAPGGGGGSISVNLDQCANNVPRGGNCTWQNGDLNGSNSQYAEGLTVPFRLSISGLTIGTPYQIHINSDWTAGGHKAYDFLASVDATETVSICAAGGGGVPAACTALGTASVHVFPENNFPAGLTTPNGPLSVTGAIAFAASAQGGGFVSGDVERQLRLYRGTINSVTDPTHTDNQGNAIVDISDLDGNTEADILVTFTPTATSVLFTWSGHLAQSKYWDGPTTPDGAGEVSGAPWHMRTQQLQTAAGSSAGNKNQDRSIQPSAILEPPVMTVSKNAGAATVNAGQPISFTIVVNNTGGGTAEGFVLEDPLPTGTDIVWTIANQSGPVTCTIASGVLRCPASGTTTFPAGATLTVQVTSPTTFASCKTYNNTATVTVTNGSSPPPAIAQTTVLCPLLSITKTADASAVSAGSPIGFTITVTNTGLGAATGVTLSDALPGGSGVSWSISPTNAGCQITGSAPTQTLSCTFGTLAATTGTASVHVVSQTVAASCQLYPNTATAQATNHAQVQAQASTTVNCGDIQITKVADAASVNAGDNIGFTITVTNDGDGEATNVTVTDVLPTKAGVVWTINPSKTGCSINNGTLTCSFGTMQPDATHSVHITSPTTFASCATISNTAMVSTGNDGGGEATANVVVNCPDLDITKTATMTTVNAGSPIGFTVQLTNSGQGVAKAVTLSDALPGGTGVDWSLVSPVTGCSITGSPPNETLDCTFGDLAPGASRTINLTSPTAFASCKAYPNTASAEATNHAEVEASASITVRCPNLSISKTADAQIVSAGSPIGFTITVTNTGTGTANSVTLTDPLPSGTDIVWTDNSADCTITANTLNCAFGNLAQGASASVHVSSPTTAASCKSYPNTATAQATNHASVEAQASTQVDCAQIDITKTADAATVNAGEPIGFTVTVSNTGAGSATSVVVTDVLPTNGGLSWSIDGGTGAAQCSIAAGTLTCQFGTMAAAATRTVHISSPTTPATCGLVSNTASVATGNDGQDEASASTTVNCPDVTVLKTAGTATVSAGDPVSFTIVVTNIGVGTAKGVTLNDPLPAGLTWSENSADCSITANVLSCTFGDMLKDATKTVTLSATSAAANCGVVSNTATVAATNEAASATANNTSTANITVNCAAIDITKTADATPVNAGEAIGFTIEVKNKGDGDATSVVVTDGLPTQAGLSWTISPATPGCSITATTLTCNFGTMAKDATKSVHITSPTTFASCATIPNTASVATGNDGSDEASANVVVQCPSLQISKTADAPTVSAGSAMGFTVTVTNTGDGVAKSVSLSDALPGGAGVSWSISPAVTGCSLTGSAPTQTLGCNFGDLAKNGVASVHVTSGTTAQSCKAYPNTASAQATNHALVQAQASTTVRCPSLTITKTPDPGTAGYLVKPGDPAKFTITVTNNGLGVATNVVLTDTLPVELTTWVEDPPTAECVIASITVQGVSRQRLRCGDTNDAGIVAFDLASGASFSVTVSATVPLDFLLVGPSDAGSPIEIDGNLADSDPANGPKDWATLGIDCTSTPKVGCDLDKPTGPTDDSFGQGTKEDTQVPTVVAGSIPNNKSDLQRFYVSKERFVTTDYLYLAWERVNEPNGTTNMDFELNQSSTLSSNGITPVRTAGDILVKYDLSRGGGSLTIAYHKWVTSGSPAVVCEASNVVPCWGKVTELDPSEVAGAANTSLIGAVVDPINPDAPRTLSVLTFGEAWINLQESEIFTPGVCRNFGRAYLKSRSSDSFSSELKDFIAPIPISVSNCTDKFLVNKAYVSGSNFSTISDVGEIKVSNSTTTSGLPSPLTERRALAQSFGIGPSVTLVTAMASTMAGSTAATTGGSVDVVSSSAPARTVSGRHDVAQTNVGAPWPIESVRLAFVRDRARATAPGIVAVSRQPHGGVPQARRSSGSGHSPRTTLT